MSQSPSALFSTGFDIDLSSHVKAHLLYVTRLEVTLDGQVVSSHLINISQRPVDLDIEPLALRAVSPACLPDPDIIEI